MNPEQEKEESIFSIPEEQRAFDQIDAETLPRKGAIEHKKQTVLEVRKNNLIDQGIIKDNPVVYVGSGIDFEYPLSLGAHHIILVDPILKDVEAIQKLKERIKTITGGEPLEMSEKELQFILSNNETVTITLAPEIYGSPKTVARYNPDNKESIEQLKRELEEHFEDSIATEEVKKAFKDKAGIFASDYNPPQPEEIPRFKPPKSIGMILGFRTTGIDIDDDKEAMENLVSGGYVLVDNAFESFFEGLSDQEKKEYLYADSPKKPIEAMKAKWQERGYDFIPLESEGNSYQYTFLKKK